MEDEKEMWNDLNIEYEEAYQSNPFKRACITKAITLLKPGSRVLDVGCGTGIPVAQMLAEARFDVEGTDVAPNMVELAKRIKGTFHVTDMVDYHPSPSPPYTGIFIIYSQLGLSFTSFNTAVKRLIHSLQPGGILVIGQSPADPEKVPPEAPEWDDTKSYVSGFNLPFMGKPFATLMFTREGQKKYLRDLGLEVVYETVDVFREFNDVRLEVPSFVDFLAMAEPKSAKAHAETQQYVIAQRPA